MKKILTLLLTVVLLMAVLTGSAGVCAEGAPAGNVYDDGRARPSSCGQLQVVNGKLSDEQGEPVMLRGVSTHDLIITESFLNDKLFGELSRDVGVNVVRLAMYTHGVGVMGYCTKGDRARYEADIDKGVTLAAASTVEKDFAEYGGNIDADYTGDLSTGSVVLTEINENVAAEGTVEHVEEVKAALEAGDVHVFDTSTFTVDGAALESYMADVDTDPNYEGDTEVISDGYFHESEYRSAPYFDLQIDGITLLDTAF